MYDRIADYALVGNTVTACLISATGSLDWCCLPRFDSPACFLHILDDERGGYCAIRADEPREYRRHYVPSTNILETSVVTATGELSVTDFMPVRQEREWQDGGRDTQAPPQVVRWLRCVRGRFRGRVEVRPTPDYGRKAASISGETQHWKLPLGDGELHVQLGWDAHVDADTIVSEIDMSAGDSGFVVLTHSATGAHETVSTESVQEKLRLTREYWQTWAKTCSYEGEHSDVVLRSALGLKLMVYELTGAIVAAPTTSLPEWPGGPRNWDYRYSWIRDSALTLVALMNLGYFGEARDFFRFLRRTLPKNPADFQIMYPVSGDSDLHEIEMNHLDGYEHSRPVRIGNGAVHQTQLDIFGELAHCIYLYWNHPGVDHGAEKFADFDADLIRESADFVCDNWHNAGSGIWEMRGPERQHTHAKAMCYVALDRAAKLASQFGLHQRDAQRWDSVRQAILRECTSAGYNPALPGFAQAYGSDAPDSALLRLPLFGVVDANDPRMQQTIATVERRLMNNGLLYRYRDANDGAGGNEGTFTTCSFWLVENYVLQDRLEDAKQMFRNVLSYANDLGLMSEEIDPETGRLLGNFPQAFTHIGLINAAVRISQAERGGKSTSHRLLEGDTWVQQPAA